MTLRFHKRIYSRKALLETIEAFRGVVEARLSSDGDHYVMEVTGVDPSEEAEIGGEILNWALGRTIEQRGEP